MSIEAITFILQDAGDRLEAALEAAVSAERERCARICEEQAEMAEREVGREMELNFGVASCGSECAAALNEAAKRIRGGEK